MAVRVFSNCLIFSTLVFTFLHTTLYFLCSNCITAWNIGCGFSQNTGELLAYRFLSGIGGSASLAVRIPRYDISDPVLDPLFLYRLVVV